MTMAESVSGRPRRFTGDLLVIASHNAGKVREIRDLLADRVARFTDAGALDLPEPEETGSTFVENAEIKARAIAKAADAPALADDSGLVVAGLDGAPGIYSARWAGPERDFRMAMERVNTLLGPSGPRDAYFACALSLAWPDGHTETVEGRVQGSLVWPPRGEHGFGYDPMFVPEGYAMTFGEMEPDAKHAISHRADAFAKLVARCFDAPG